MTAQNGGIITHSNNNSASRGNHQRRRQRQTCLLKLIVVACGVIVSYQLAWTYWLAGVGIPDVEIDKITGQKRVRRRPDLLKKHDYATGRDVPTSPFDGIMEGYLTLIGLQVPKEGLVPASPAAASSSPYANVKAVFCHISWHKHQREPHKLPLFKDLQAASMMCPSTTYAVDMGEIVSQARQFDNTNIAGGTPANNLTFVASQPRRPVHVEARPTAVIFHESRCGSTLIANLLAGFAPERTRVYTEASPPIQALLACPAGYTTVSDSTQLAVQVDSGQTSSITGSSSNRGGPVCEEQSHMALIRDVFYLMGRVQKAPVAGQYPRNYVFYKLSSIGTLAMEAFAKAMPTTPWMFNYRDPVEVLMSHFKPYQVGEAVPADHRPVCLRSYGQPDATLPPLMHEIVATATDHKKTPAQLSKEEFCAAHLATLSTSAYNEYQRTVDSPMLVEHGQKKKTLHWLVDYHELPYMIWETILPDILGTHHLLHDKIVQMQEIANKYSKGRDGHPLADKKWKEDTTLKQGKAPQHVREAAETFLYPIYHKLDALRQELEGK